MPRVKCSKQLSPDCKGEYEEAPADPEKPPLCSRCAALMLEAMTDELDQY